MVLPNPFIRPATAAKIKALRKRGSATTQILQDPVVILAFRSGPSTIVKANVQPIKIRVDTPATDTVGQAIMDTITTGTATFWAEDIDLIRIDHWFRWDDRLCTVTGPATPIRNGTRKLHFRIDGERT